MSRKKDIPKNHLSLPKDHLEFLQEQFLMVLSTIGEDGRPHAATVFYWINDIIHGDFNVYFVTRRHTRKFKDMVRDPRVALVVGTSFEPFTVQIEGEAELVEAQDSYPEMVETARRLHAHHDLAMLYSGEFLPRSPFSQMEGEDFALMRVRPSWVRAMRYDEGKGELVFEQVKP